MDRDEFRRLRSLYQVGLISYLLHLIVAVGALIPGGQWGPTLLLVALVIDFVKREDAAGTWHESHFRWRLRSVVFALVAYLVTAPLWLFFLLPGYIAWTLVSAWFLYRVVKGLYRLHAGRAMEFQ